MRRDTGAVDAAGMQTGLELAEEELAAHQLAEEQLNRELENRRRDLFSTLAEAAQFKNRSETAQNRLTFLKERLERHSREAVQLAERREQLRRQAGELEKNIAASQQEQTTLQTRLSTLREHEDDLKRRLPEIEKGWQSRRDELNRGSSRLHSLKELQAQFAGFGQGVRTLMKDTALRSRFSGVLADAIQAPPELESALESALADRLQCLLCADDKDAVSALDFLKSKNGGRAGIALPLNLPSAAPPLVTGATALLKQVQADGPYAGLILNLLATVMLVDDTAAALRLARQHPALTFVTPAGDMVAQGGVVSGGSAEQAGSGLIHKKREIRELELLVAGLEEETAALSKQREDLRRQSLEVAEGLKSGGMQLHQAELKLTGLLKDRQQALDESQRIAERLEVQSGEAANLHEEQTALESELKLSGEQALQAGDVSKRLELETSRLKVELEARRVLLAAAREKVTGILVQTATIKEQHEAGLRALSELEQRMDEILTRASADRKELESGAAARQQLETEISTATARMEGLLREQTEAESRLTVARNRFEESGAALALLEALLKQSREESDAAREAQAGLNLRFSTLTMQSEHLEQNLHERSRISMAEALTRLESAGFDETAGRARRVELQRLLDEMGEVNLMAIEECSGMEERFSFLNGQKDDLEESLRGLQQAIQRINRTTRQRFLETYNLINAKFQEVFPRLFCGGHAELRLTDEEDLLETGIDIIVQPPGKKLQNVTLLSGGEKALTAVALIFSIFLIKPTPFCLLDEVDAPLDDANIGRFNEMVREMSDISQFIIITHNKATMQVADTLYGITMEEPGASKVVSVRLH